MNWFEPEWDKEAATMTFWKNAGKLFADRRKKERFTLLGIEEIPFVGWGVKIRIWPTGETEVVPHNAITEGGWQVIEEPYKNTQRIRD